MSVESANLLRGRRLPEPDDVLIPGLGNHPPVGREGQGNDVLLDERKRSHLDSGLHVAQEDGAPIRISDESAIGRKSDRANAAVPLARVAAELVELLPSLGIPNG